MEYCSQFKRRIRQVYQNMNGRYSKIHMIFKSYINTIENQSIKATITLG